MPVVYTIFNKQLIFLCAHIKQVLRLYRASVHIMDLLKTLDVYMHIHLLNYLILSGKRFCDSKCGYYFTLSVL